MVICANIRDLSLDGVDLIAGEGGLNRSVSWTYVVLTRPYDEHMNRGNFAMMVVDFERFDFEEAYRSMVELNDLGISGLALSVREDSVPVPDRIIQKADALNLPLFYVRWKGASFVDIAQSIGNLITETNIQNKREGDYLYNLLFGYDIHERYIEKISRQFGVDFTRPYRVGIIVVDRVYGVNLEQDEHYYEYYTNSLQYRVSRMEGHPMFMAFLNKFVLLFEARPDKAIEHELEAILKEIDGRPQFKGLISGTCILGAAYSDPKSFSQSYQEAKNLISHKNLLPNPKHKKVLSASSMGLYKYLFNSGNQGEILKYCNERLRKLEEYDHAKGTFLLETLLEYYMHGFNNARTAEALFIHRNSLQNRLDKIEELLGFELNDYTEYLDLLNCILVKRMMYL